MCAPVRPPIPIPFWGPDKALHFAAGGRAGRRRLCGHHVAHRGSLEGFRHRRRSGARRRRDEGRLRCARLRPTHRGRTSRGTAIGAAVGLGIAFAVDASVRDRGRRSRHALGFARFFLTTHLLNRRLPEESPRHQERQGSPREFGGSTRKPPQDLGEVLAALASWRSTSIPTAVISPPRCVRLLRHGRPGRPAWNFETANRSSTGEARPSSEECTQPREVNDQSAG